MRPWFVLLAVGALSTGCTHVVLEHRTVNQASTVPDLQYQQVLDNLAMFACTKDALPWHVKVKGGTIQVTDQATGGFLAVIPSAVSDSVKALFTPSTAGQRTALQQWDVDPAIELDELESLQLAYQKAIDPRDQGGTIRHEVLEKICELCLKYSILPKEDTLREILNNRRDNLSQAIDRLEKGIEAAEAAKAGDLKEQLTAVKERLEKMVGQDGAHHIAHLYTQSLVYRPLARLPANASLADIRALRKESANDPKTLLLTALQIACEGGYLPPGDAYAPLGRNPGLIDQAQDKIKTLQDLIQVNDNPKFDQPWLCMGPKKSVPGCVCHVGHYCHCGCDCYVWVTPDHMKTLRDFTLAILSLAPPDKQDFSSVISRGAAVGPPQSLH